MENSLQSESFYELFRSVRNEIADEHGYHLETAIKKTFDKWNEWKKGMPDFDGKYLVLIEHIQDCGNTLKYQEVVECSFNNWILKDKQKVIGWKQI